MRRRLFDAASSAIGICCDTNIAFVSSLSLVGEGSKSLRRTSETRSWRPFAGDILDVVCPLRNLTNSSSRFFFMQEFFSRVCQASEKNVAITRHRTMRSGKRRAVAAGSLVVVHGAMRARDEAHSAADMRQAGDARPVEERPRIGLAAGRDVGMCGKRNERIALAQNGDQHIQRGVLGVGIRPLVAAFELDANRKIVAAPTAAPVGCSGMPRARIAGDELHNLAVSPDEEMCRDAKPGDIREVRMRGGRQTVCEKFGDTIAAEFSGRQADRMNDQQRWRFAVGPLIAVRGRNVADACEPAGGIERADGHSSMPSRSIR